MTKIGVGVPQGSILGPLLFLIFINDLLSTRMSGEVICFADDTNVFNIGDTIDVIASAMRTDLEVLKWVSMNQLCVNVNKTNYIIFSKPNKKVDNINDEVGRN